MKVLLALSTFLYAQTVAAADFRGNEWGDNLEDVRALEGPGTSVIGLVPSGGGGNTWVYTSVHGTVHLGVGATIEFWFTPDWELGVGKCRPDNGDLTAFYIWEGELSSLYGEPENRDDILTADEAILYHYYRGEPDAVAEGLMKGYYALLRYWETDNTYIWLIAEELEGRLYVHLEYYAKEYSPFFSRERKKLLELIEEFSGRRGLRPWFDEEN